MKRVLKYATGEEILSEAKYLKTEVEWEQGSRWEKTPTSENPNQEERVYYKKNVLVWHYYEVESA